MEYSDLKNEDGAQALNKLVEELIPQVKLQWQPLPKFAWLFHLYRQLKHVCAKCRLRQL